MLRATVATGGGGSAVGTIVSLEDGLLVACGGGTAVRLLDVQPASRKAMPAAAFAAGARVRVGDRLG